MKGKLTEWYCMSNECTWKETSHRLLDGIKCPECNGPVLGKRVQK